MTKQRILDSHVHLYRRSNWGYLRWEKNTPLYKDNEVEQYRADIDSDKFEIQGLVFMECNPKEDLEKGIEGCQGAIDEYNYIGRLLSGNRLETEGQVGEKDSEFIKAIVPWAPVPLGGEAVSEYVDILKKDASTFSSVKGFRYLLQDKPPGTMTTPKFISSLKWLEANNFAFDWGIDFRCGGVWQFEETIEVFRQVPNVKYIINHLTKPNLRLDPKTVESTDEFKEWKKLTTNIYELSPNSYMKLSGGYSEFSEETSKDIEKCVEYIYPWFKVCFDLWGPERTIWDSNWPFCDMSCPGNICDCWFDITERLLDIEKVDKDTKDKIYFKNIIEAYNI